MNTYRIGIDLGGTKIESILLSPDLRELCRERIPTPAGNQYDLIVKAVYAQIRAMAEKIPGNGDFTVGIGIPGAVQKETGRVHNANTTCLIGKPFQTDLETLCQKRVIIENDANCFTLTEALQGAGKDYGMVFGVIMGTGCGGGLCINKKIWGGANGIAGEWGHFSVDPGGRTCYCGNRGCVETKISGTGVEASYYEIVGRHIKMKDLVQGYRQGDELCKTVFLRFLEDFGRALGGLISVLDPDAVVIGGGLSHIDEIYTLGVDQVRKYAFHKNIQTPILKNRLGDSSGVVGAALLNG
ncbi:MAG: ROK family protein [Desulfobacteraceae bacterium]|nr:ROK family protein [Desulfobacteraceae bacterium]